MNRHEAIKNHKAKEGEPTATSELAIATGLDVVLMGSPDKDSCIYPDTTTRRAYINQRGSSSIWL